jgi:hypothetical protein
LDTSLDVLSERGEKPGHDLDRTPAEAKERKEKTMRVMVIIKANKDTEAGIMPGEDILTAMGNFNEELVKAGIMLAGEGLHPSSRGKRIQLGAGKPAVIDGPFAETKELIAGFWLWKVKSMDEAVEWAKRIPNPRREEVTIEIRKVFEDDDFGEAFTPELREQEARLRADAERNARKG